MFLYKVTFSLPSSLERIGKGAFSRTLVREVSIPDSVLELCELCFGECQRLTRIVFGVESSLKRIGSGCFAFSGLQQFEMPRSVVYVGGGAFNECPLVQGFVCSAECRCHLTRGLLLANGLLFDNGFTRCHSCFGPRLDIFVPDSVRELYAC